MKIENIEVANTIAKRTRGLLGRKPLLKNEGLLLCKCKAIHTMFMKYPIDVLFINRDLIVVGIENHILPWKKSKYYKNAYYVLEIYSQNHNFKVGEKMINLLKKP